MIIGILEQSTTFEPFMWKFSTLAMIARGASQDDEVDIMSWSSFSTTYRNRVLKMVDVSPVPLLKFGMTACGIVASIVLSLQFLLYLLRRQRAFYRPFACSVSMSTKTAYHLAVFCLLVCMPLILVSIIIVSVEFKIVLMPSLTILFFVFAYLLMALLLMSLHVCRYFILAALPVFLVACPAFSAETIPSPRVTIKELRSSGERVFTPGALLAGYIVLGYSVHTSELTFHSSRPGVFQHRSDTTLLPPHYTTNPPVKQCEVVQP